ncbi:MAG: hypothetical protein BIFFINMI_03650 [Phycisphaerae bacterium]|nr:hypothetical protein [Phycisphaerae bacterium]
MSWKKFKAAIAHAFAVEDGRDRMSPEDIALLDKVAAFVVRRRLVAPAILVLESTGPFGFLGSSALTFFRPIVSIVFDTREYERIERLMERRCAADVLIERIELAEHQRVQAGKAKKAPPDEPPGDPSVADTPAGADAPPPQQE